MHRNICKDIVESIFMLKWIMKMYPEDVFKYYDLIICLFAEDTKELLHYLSFVLLILLYHGHL